MTTSTKKFRLSLGLNKVVIERKFYYFFNSFNRRLRDLNAKVLHINLTPYTGHGS